MNSETKLIKSRVGLLNLTEQLNNVTRACKLMGTSRDSFYRIKQLYDTGVNSCHVDPPFLHVDPPSVFVAGFRS